MGSLSIRHFQTNQTKKCQVIEIRHRKGPNAQIPRDQMQGIVNAIALHGEPIGRVAKRSGYSINPLVSELVDTLLDWGTAQYEHGVAVGSRPTPPASPMRPQLRRAA